MRGSGIKLQQGRCRLDIGNNFSESDAQVAQEVGGGTIPGGFQNCGYVALRDVVIGHSGGVLGLASGIREVLSNL